MEVSIRQRLTVPIMRKLDRLKKEQTNQFSSHDLIIEK